jgi:hypothetical protein
VNVTVYGAIHSVHVNRYTFYVLRNNSSNYAENINQKRTKFIHSNGWTPRIFARLQYSHAPKEPINLHSTKSGIPSSSLVPENGTLPA